MFGRKRFYNIWKDGNYSKYVWNTFTYNLKKYTIDAVKSTYLSIRFPFLYPKNAYSGSHYRNWTLERKMSEIYMKWSNFADNNQNLYIDKFGEDCSFCEGKHIKVEYILKLAPFKDRFLYSFYNGLCKFLGVIFCIPTYSNYDAIPKGWRKRFGIQLCKELKQAIKKSGGRKYMKEFQIFDIKEKWGRLEIYTSGQTPEVTRVINKYNYISQFVCITCGEDAVKQTLGWVCPYCEDCVPEHERFVWINPIYGWSNSETEKKNKEILDEMK